MIYYHIFSKNKCLIILCNFASQVTCFKDGHFTGKQDKMTDKMIFAV